MTKTRCRNVTVLLVALLIISTWTGYGNAEEKFPTKEITIVCPYSAGGDTDAIARIFAKTGQRYFGVPLIVVNKTGGAAMAGLRAAIQDSKPDGYTWAEVVDTQVTNKIRGVRGPDVLTDCEPICMAMIAPVGIAVRGNSKYKTLQDLIDDARKNPEKIKVGVAAVGGSYSVAMFLLEEAAGVKFKLIPHAGTAVAITEALAGEYDVVPGVYSAFAAYIGASPDKSFRFLAFLSDKRELQAPNVPTSRELGYNASYYVPFAFFVSKDVPKDRLAKLQSMGKQVIQSSDFKELMKKAGNIPAEYMEPTEITRLFQNIKSFVGKLYTKGLIPPEVE
jgi:tripartite-type tricarboxylate transporter receptor subunit TctC